MTEQQREVLKRAVKMLREEALGIQQGHTLSGNWDGEEEAKSAHDEMLAVASQLEALSHAEGEAVGSLAIDKGGSELFRATVAMQDLDPGMYDLYTHPAPQVAVPEPVGWVKWFDDEPSFQPRDALMPEDAKQHGWQLVGLMRSMNAPTAPAGEQPVSDPDGLPDRVLMPRALTAENGAKTALMGEFDFSVTMTCPECHPDDPNPDCEVCSGSVEYEQPHTVPWTTIKRIYTAAVDLLSAPAPDEREIAALALERHADSLIVMAERDGRNNDRESQQTWEEAAYFAKQEAARLRAGKEGQ